MAEENNSVDEILKEILSEEGELFLTKPVDKDLPKNNTKVNISVRTGIPEATLGRYLKKGNKSYANLVEAMQILSVMGRREAILKFGDKSNTEAARFIKAYYAQYLEKNPAVAPLKENSSLTDEMLRISAETNDAMEKKSENLRYAVWTGTMIFLIAGGFYIKMNLDIIKRELLSGMNQVIEKCAK